jgi:hypothetical protein
MSRQPEVRQDCARPLLHNPATVWRCVRDRPPCAGPPASFSGIHRKYAGTASDLPTDNDWRCPSSPPPHKTRLKCLSSHLPAGAPRSMDRGPAIARSRDERGDYSARGRCLIRMRCPGNRLTWAPCRLGVVTPVSCACSARTLPARSGPAGSLSGALPPDRLESNDEAAPRIVGRAAACDVRRRTSQCSEAAVRLREAAAYRISRMRGV